MVRARQRLNGVQQHLSHPCDSGLTSIIMAACSIRQGHEIGDVFLE